MRNEAITIIGQANDWYNIVTSSGTKGWVHTSYVSVSSYQQNVATRGGNSAPRQEEKDVLELRTDIVEEAKKYLGVKYVYGGSSPSGFDCSGLIWYVFKNHGINLNRVAADQAKQGTWVAKENLVAGDLVFFDTRGTGSYINHVGIYIGNGNFIHASSGSSARCVVISDLTTGFYQKTYMTARSVF
ncbi:MAG: C40 family peptidase [Clostridium sp.]|nr:C40 family peptidase [Clostridium sp.]